MAIELGDRVRFVNEDMEGTVTKIMDQKTVGVTTDDDFEIPVLRSELVKVSFTGDEPVKVIVKDAQPVKTTTRRNELGLLLLFEPKSDKFLQMKLANLLSEEVMYVSGTFAKNKYVTRKKGTLQLDEVITIDTFSLEEFNEWPELVFSFIPCPSVSETIEKPIQKRIKFHAKEFHGSFKFSSIIQKQAYVFRLDEEVNFIDLQKLKNRDFGTKQFPELVEGDSTNTNSSSYSGSLPSSDIYRSDIYRTSSGSDVPGVIDLHIEAIPNAPANLRPQEILQTQFGHFRRMLEKGLATGIEKMVFVHGVGDGVLKKKIREYLHTYPKIKKAGDADEFKYGKGATEVEF